MKILVIQLKMIGDVLASSMICNNLRNEYPKAQIDYLVYPFTKPILENNPNIDHIIQFSDEIQNNWFRFAKFIISIKKTNYDIVIDAYGKIESTLITRFSGAPKRIGFKEKEKFGAYNFPVEHHNKPRTTAGLAIERRENLLKDLMTKQIDNFPMLFVSESEKQKARDLLRKKGIDFGNDYIIMISILGSGIEKTYPEKYLIELINTIAKYKNVKLLFNRIPNQSTEAKNIYDQCSEEAKSKIYLDIVGENLRSLIGILYYCKMLVGNDGGAVNMAKALQKPTFTIFSPWIRKESWSIFEDGIFHKAVHLEDFSPELFKDKSRKELKKNFEHYYKLFSPSLIIKHLTDFLNNHLSKNV